MIGKTKICNECGSSIQRVRIDYRFEESGLDNVILAGIEVDRCPQCGGESPRIPRLNDVMDTIAVALIAKPFELTGRELRFLRKTLAVGIEDFARKLGIDRSHLSRVENGAFAISRQTDRLVRTLVLLHRPELMEKLTTMDNRESVLKRLEEIKPESATVIVELRQTPNGYNFKPRQAA